MRILLVDDSRSASTIFSARLANFGHEVSCAENGAVAVEKFKALAPDLVLMDIEMPVMDGFAATHQIRLFEASQAWAWTPIIFLTAVATTENFVTSVDAGGDDLLPKTVDDGVLRTKLMAMERVARLRQRLYVANQQMEEDIQARKLAEAELSRRCIELSELNAALSAMQTQLIQSEKLASIGQLAAGVAHEINTPIGFVLSNLGSLRKYLDDLSAGLAAYEEVVAPLSAETAAALRAVRQRFDLDYIREDAPSLIDESCDGIRRVARIVQGLRDFSELDSREAWQTFDLNAGIEAALRRLREEMPVTAEFVTEFGDLPPIECLPEQIVEVCRHVLKNAVQAIGDRPGGRIRIRTAAGNTGLVHVDIADNGIGMAPETVAKVFDPFFTTQPVGSGAGLGLALSYGIVKNHGGRIEVKSALNKGSCFRLVLPVSARRQDEHLPGGTAG
ncbi:ATP-binding protein [uncultured Propionivibrio sp.]|uniref:ATP-binding protein n=1 Tax=uncultured Propionivibrio sp. TaxID=426737 RepID=UPI0029C04517|nr:ATP-binding protein [uncultured Propionivibrio sp.]